MEPNEVGYGWRGTDYTAFRTDAAPGRPSADDWRAAPRTARFVDLVHGGPALLDTYAQVVWDDDALHVRFWADEPNVTATMTERDSLLFFENDVEVFVDGGDAYYELEVNALGQVYEVFYIWRDAYLPAGRWDTARFDVHQPRVHSFAGDHERTATSFWTGEHPRGTRWAYLDYDLPGLEVRVDVDGRINDPSTVDRGWSTVVTLPWAGLADLADGRALPPRDGDQWRLFLGRFQHLPTRDPAVSVSVGWAANAHGVNDTHVPESWTVVTFDARAVRDVHGG